MSENRRVLHNECDEWVNLVKRVTKQDALIKELTEIVKGQNASITLILDRVEDLEVRTIGSVRLG